MTKTLQVIDEALPWEAFQYWADYARNVEYQTVVHPVDGLVYRNVGRLPEGQSLVGFFARALGVPVLPRFEFFRYGEPGDGAANIHCDNGDAAYASVLYMNTPIELVDHPTGTAFFWSKAIKCDRLPKGADLSMAEAVNRDRANPDAWEMTYTIQAATNRLIVYPTNLFHARWPLEPAAGRLVHVAFFDVP